MSGLRAIMTCVDYWDFLAVTLPYNRHHFSEVMVVTSLYDDRTTEVAHANDCRTFHTDLFHRNGAFFNKWAALEAGLDELGREGWLCIMDPDVLWPTSLEVTTEPRSLYFDDVVSTITLLPGQLAAPLRRMYDDFTGEIPEEDHWDEYPIHRNVSEWAGYSQIFHADDPHLPAPPWHATDWVHAGGADSFLQQKWPKESKIRPQFNVLHVGKHGHNWFGRTTDYLDGTEVSKEVADRRRARLNKMRVDRKTNRGSSQPFKGERLK